MDFDAIDQQEAALLSAPANAQRHAVASTLIFLAPFLDEYFRRNEGLPAVSLREVAQEYLDQRRHGTDACATYVAAFDELMLDADDTDRWYDATTQDTLLLTLSVALLTLYEEGTVEAVLSECIDTLAKILVELPPTDDVPAELATMASGLNFILTSDFPGVAAAAQASAQKLQEQT